MPTLPLYPVLRRLGLLLVAAALLQCTGCAGSGKPSLNRGGSSSPSRPDQWPTADNQLSLIRAGCDVLAGPARPGGSFVFALTQAVQPAHAPVPHNRAERIVFAQLYETLVNVACDGTATPGLAENWTCTDDSTTWVFTLREGARFWDGTRVTADDVRRSWSANQAGEATVGTASPWTWINARAASITAVDARRLAIQLPEPQARFPLLLAHPAAAVALRQPGWTWPVGSGPCRLRASDPAPRPDLTCQPNPAHPDHPLWKSLVFRVTPDTDPRDLVATEIDLAVVQQLATVRFFDGAPGFTTHALPWDCLYLLVCPPAQNPAGSTRWTTAAAGLQLAEDVTDVSVHRWAQIMFPASHASTCPQLSGPIASRKSAPLNSDLPDRHLDASVIAYPGDRAGAAELAARVSHLAGSGTRVAELSPSDLELALQWQMAGAFVVVQDQLFPTGCLQLAGLLGHAAWLQKAGLKRPARSPAATLTADGIVRPLALSRYWLVARGELAGLRLDFDGTPLLSGLGRAAQPKATP